ncbi:hypothetical protein PUP66_23160 [Pseudomonas chlororaphis]|uniref:hypothetical protein n=1 Tax=Pseudomonas chlororaphis TaxID=587753 RepID=UPI000F551A87|nr:hypothetical protein [Pseudomonas chlororaphis]AZD17386.1 hypothetical protein C4K25_4475 [Pseudomonas chlororaphis]WDH45963.1 hypothetical protein PUP66_23160 [Pseudomonas chlororaphis]WDH57810.1 hypothetical protein PUP56_23165 [Pseudomonas chlororaphis]WQE17067.1 hypothetical protein U0007_21980 [Pseudomonas chlororaphis]
MALLGVDQKAFDTLRSEVEQKLETLRQEIRTKATDSEETASKAAKNSKAIEEQILATKTNIDTALTELTACNNEAKAELAKTQKTRALIENDKALTEAIVTSNKAALTELLSTKEQAETQASEVTTSYAVIKAALTESQKLPEQVEAIKTLLADSKILSESMDSLLNHSMKRKTEIDELHKEILGSEIKGSDGTTARTDGLVDELKTSYDGIANQAVELNETIQNLVTSITEKHEIQLKKETNEFEELVLESKNRISAIDEQLTGLLPGAMAEGLSAAYEKKKDDEIVSQKKYETSFAIAIGLMVSVSLIPFFVDIYLLGWKGSDLVQVIKDTPSLIISILPLYFPVLWFAYSSNKKLNLSKRLIEEYTHKAVLGKTFSGLSNQIESLPRDNLVRDELRTRLLFNLLQVSSENPGKLITDYNKSDHPLMDALENSAKLSDSMEALSKIPGFSAISKKLGETAERILKAENQKVENGLAVQQAIEEPTAKAGV